MRAARALASAKSPVSSNLGFRSSPHGSKLNPNCVVSVALLNLAASSLSRDRVFVDDGCPDLPQDEKLFLLAQRRAHPGVSFLAHSFLIQKPLLNLSLVLQVFSSYRIQGMRI